MNPLLPNDWHTRPAECLGQEKDGPCSICGCPAAGTRKNRTYHRATLEAEGFAFRFLTRKKSATGWQVKGLCPVARAIGDQTAQAPADPPTVELLIKTTLNPGDATLALMARAAMLHVMGKPFPQIEAAMQLKRRAVVTWKGHWPEHWEMACESARQQVIKLARAQIGTAAVLDDVDGHLERAQYAADAGALPKPEPDKPTVCTFFESYVLPTCFYDDKPRTIDTYRNALNLWKLITGDPPLESVTAQTMALFRDALSKRRGKQSYRKASANTVASRLRFIQTILDKAGPVGKRNRDATGLLAAAPWIRPPRTEQTLPRVIPPELFQRVHDAAAGMDKPWYPGIKPPAWWKALLSVTYNTQLRRRTLFEMRMDEIDWPGDALRLPAGRFKARRPMIVHLNPAAMQALRGIRTARELVFPFDHNTRTFDYWFHHLQDLAGIPKKEHFGLHAIRKTAATVLAGFAPQIAQLALGHNQLATTLDSYINPTPIIGPALDAMPQPFGVIPT